MVKRIAGKNQKQILGLRKFSLKMTHLVRDHRQKAGPAS
jgi:hypothetical protein